MATKRRQQMENLAEYLNGEYPGLFDKQRPQPLKTGIHIELASVVPNPQRRVLWPFLSWWCHRRAYLKAMQDRRRVRRGLDGSSQRIPDKHRKHAGQFLAMRERRERRRMATKRHAKARSTSG